MFGLTVEKLLIYLAIVVAVFTAGWTVNGWRWHSQVLASQAALQKAVSDAKDAQRQQELNIQASANIERNRKDAEITVIRSQLDAALVELRKRPARGASLPSAAGVGRPATGSDLSREDAEFLVREAARGQSYFAELRACYATYNDARAALMPQPK